jgi:hypothetical protein
MIVRRIGGIFRGAISVPSQVVYQTNADLIGSQEALVKNSLVIADMTEKGLLWFRFIDSPTVFQLSAMGKLQVKWKDIYEKRTLYKLIKKLLVPLPGEKLVIKPLRQQTWIDYPPPGSFKLYWCDQATEFVLKKEPETGQQQSGKSQDELATVMKAVEELRREFRFFREPTRNEVALKSGCLHSNALDTGLMFARCKPESWEGAKWVAEKALNLAGWLCFKESGELNPQLIALTKQAIDTSSMEIIARAQEILKNYPDLVPKVNVTELKWPDETKTKWIQVFGYPPPAPQRWILWPTSLLSRSD